MLGPKNLYGVFISREKMAFFTKVNLKIPVIPHEDKKRLVLTPTVQLPPGGEMV